MNKSDITFIIILFFGFLLIIVLFFTIGDESEFHKLSVTNQNMIMDLIVTPAGNTVSESIPIPINVSSSFVDQQSTMINWTPVESAESYVVYQSLVPNFSYNQVNSLQTTFSNKATFPLISNGISNNFRVSAVISGYESPTSTSIVVGNNYKTLDNEYFILQPLLSTGIKDIIYFDTKDPTLSYLLPYSSINQVINFQDSKMTLPLVSDYCIGINSDKIISNCNSKWTNSDEQFCSNGICLTKSEQMVIPGINVYGIKYRTEQYQNQRWNKISVSKNLFLTPYFYILANLSQKSYPLIAGSSSDNLTSIIVGSNTFLNEQTLIFYYVNVTTEFNQQNKKYYSGYLFASNFSKSLYYSVIAINDKIWLSSSDKMGTLFSIYEDTIINNGAYSNPTSFYVLSPDMMWTIRNSIGSPIYLSDISNQQVFNILKYNYSG